MEKIQQLSPIAKPGQRWVDIQDGCVVKILQAPVRHPKKQTDALYAITDRSVHKKAPSYVRLKGNGTLERYRYLDDKHVDGATPWTLYLPNLASLPVEKRGSIIAERLIKFEETFFGRRVEGVRFFGFLDNGLYLTFRNAETTRELDEAFDKLNEYADKIGLWIEYE